MNIEIKNPKSTSDQSNYTIVTLVKNRLYLSNTIDELYNIINKDIFSKTDVFKCVKLNNTICVKNWNGEKLMSITQ